MGTVGIVCRVMRTKITVYAIGGVTGPIIFRPHDVRRGPVRGSVAGVRPGGRRIDAAQHHLIEEYIGPPPQGFGRFLSICRRQSHHLSLLRQTGGNRPIILYNARRGNELPQQAALMFT